MSSSSCRSGDVQSAVRSLDEKDRSSLQKWRKISVNVALKSVNMKRSSQSSSSSAIEGSVEAAAAVAPKRSMLTIALLLISGSCLLLFYAYGSYQRYGGGLNASSTSASTTLRSGPQRSAVGTAASIALNRGLEDQYSANQDGKVEVLPLDFASAKLELQSVLSLIWHRYELHSQQGHNFFNAANNLGPETWNMLKYKFALKILLSRNPEAIQREQQQQQQQELDRKIAPISAERVKSFLMVFSGSSVTAGHDSYYAQSYPYIFKKRMIGIFEKLGMSLVVRNIALGANNCSPYVLCYESMGGFDADFLNWEQSYNCGHDDPVFEATARVVGRNLLGGGVVSRGDVVYYSASGAWAPSDCPKADEAVPYSSEDWTPATAGLSEWKPSREQLDTIRDTLFKFHSSKPSYQRFAAAFKNDYKGVGFHGFNVWENNPMCKYQKDGKEMTGCNGIDAAMKCTMKFMSQEAAVYGSDTGKGANWHPTRAFHMLRGEAIAWLYALILMDTVHMLEADIDIHSRQTLIDEYSSKLEKLTPKMPTPKKCDGFYHCKLLPECFTDYKPHYPAHFTLSELVVGETKWSYDSAKYAEWSLHYGYLDAKPVFEAKEGVKSGELHLLVEISSNHPLLWICGQKKESLMHARIMIDKNVDLRLEERFALMAAEVTVLSNEPLAAGDINANRRDIRAAYIPSEHRTEWNQLKVVGNECRELNGLPGGTHVVSISTRDSQPTHVSDVTHVIMWR